VESGANEVVNQLSGASANTPNPTWVLLAVIALCIIATGIRFFSNFFQAYFLPHLSLKRIAEEDHQFYSFAIVLCGCLLIPLGLSLTGPSLDKVADTQISSIVSVQMMSASSPYKDIAQEKATADLTGWFTMIFHDNILVLPVVPLALWFVTIILLWLFGKLFQTPLTLGHFIRTMSYNGFLYGLAAGLAIYAQVMSMSGDPFPSWLTLVSLLLGFYAVIHFIISLVQGLDVPPTGIIVSLILTLVIMGGIGWFLNYQYIAPNWQTYWNGINSFDPSRGIM
jgi:hypothetical protein